MKENRKKRTRKPATLGRIAAEFIVLVLIHAILAQILARVHLAEHILSPGKDSYFAICVMAFFMMIRGIVIVFGLGWLLARLWLYFTRTSPINRTTNDVP